MTNTTFTPGPTPNTVRSANGKIHTPPEDWALLPPGDAALTHWVIQEKKGRRIFSKGVWAPATTINKIRADLKAERSTDRYVKRKEADATSVKIDGGCGSSVWPRPPSRSARSCPIY